MSVTPESHQQKKGMNITRLAITIEPWASVTDRYDLNVEVMADGALYRTRLAFHSCDFESYFDTLMSIARDKIVQTVKNPQRMEAL